MKVLMHGLLFLGLGILLVITGSDRLNDINRFTAMFGGFGSSAISFTDAIGISNIGEVKVT